MSGSLKYVEGDLFEAIDKVTRPTIIAHLCNNQGKWGAGFVIPLGKKFPEAKKRYLNWNWDTGDDPPELGMSQMILVREDPPHIYVANMISQELGGARPLWYDHLCINMIRVVNWIDGDGEQIYAPLFGAGLAGGDWRVISALIEDCWVRRGIDVTIFYLPGQKPDCVD